MKNLPLSRIMNRSIVTIAPDATLHAVSALMERHGVHHLLVMESGRMVGIVSSADLLKVALLQLPEPHPESPAIGDSILRVRDIMQSRVAVLRENASLKEAANALLLGGFHAIPVVALDGTPVGMITSSDIAALLVEQIDEHAPAQAAAATAAHAATTSEVRCLRDVLRAADVYLHSGDSSQQHARLLNAVSRAKEAGGARPLSSLS